MSRSTAILLPFIFVFASTLPPLRAADESGEIIIISGGPALQYWENYRNGPDQHDKWWGNFIRTARIRFEELRKEQGEDAMITWLVYRPGYARRAHEQGEPLLSWIESVRDRCGVRLLWYSSSDELINYLNSGRDRNAVKIAGLEYFGHSNKHCWIFDYSNHILGASKAWLHEQDFGRIHRGIFTRDPVIKSWGCHTGESMSEAWRKRTGTRMIGAYGKTDYSQSWKNVLPHISTFGGHWKY